MGAWDGDVGAVYAMHRRGGPQYQAVVLTYLSRAVEAENWSNRPILLCWDGFLARSRAMSTGQQGLGPHRYVIFPFLVPFLKFLKFMI